MTKEELKQKVSVIISSETSGNDKRDRLLKLFEELESAYWKERAEAAEAVILKLNKHINVFDYDDNDNWQRLKNQQG